MNLSKIKNQITELSNKFYAILLVSEVMNNNNVKLKFLLSKHNLSNSPSEQEELIKYAKTKENYQALKIMFDSGFDPNVRNKNNDTLLFIAARAGSYAFAQILIDAGADLNSLNGKEGRTPLMSACVMGHTDIVKLLMQSKANPDICTLSQKHSFDPIQESLIAIQKQLYGADKIKSDVTFGRNALMESIGGLQEKRLECMKIMLDHGANINATNDLGVDLLEYAKLVKDQEIVDFVTSYKEQMELDKFVSADDSAQDIDQSLNF